MEMTAWLGEKPRTADVAVAKAEFEKYRQDLLNKLSPVERHFEAAVRTLKQLERNAPTQSGKSQDKAGEKMMSLTIRTHATVKRSLTIQAARPARRRSQTMRDWEDKPDAFLQFNEREVLTHAGKRRGWRRWSRPGGSWKAKGGGERNDTPKAT